MGATVDEVATTLEGGAFRRIDALRARPHVKSDGNHEHSGDIGTLPTYPEKRQHLDAADDDIRKTATDGNGGSR
jgi:hypothetical protein